MKRLMKGNRTDVYKRQVFLFLAFLLSPFGLQAVADFLIEVLDGGKNALCRFLAG